MGALANPPLRRQEARPPELHHAPAGSDSPQEGAQAENRPAESLDEGRLRRPGHVERTNVCPGEVLTPAANSGTTAKQHRTQMRIDTLLTLAAGFLALGGCSSTPTRVDSGPIHARTFSFVSRGNRASPNYVDDRQPVHTMVQEAITRNLATHGVTKAATGSDITVGYLIIVGNNASTASIADYFGYGEDAAALQDKAHNAYTGSKNPNYFEAGTLV